MNDSIRIVKFLDHSCSSGHCWLAKLTPKKVLLLTRPKKGIKYLIVKRSQVVKAKGLNFL